MMNIIAIYENFGNTLSWHIFIDTPTFLVYCCLSPKSLEQFPCFQQKGEIMTTQAWENNEDYYEALEQGTSDEVRAAHAALVKDNQKLAYKIVHQWSWACDGGSRSADRALQFSDLYQHALIGLWIAAQKFDPSGGNKFSTYAMWRIREQVSRAVMNSGVVRIPVHMRALINKFIAIERMLPHVRYSADSLKEIQRCLGLGEESFFSLLHAVTLYRDERILLNSVRSINGEETDEQLGSLLWKDPKSGTVHMGGKDANLSDHEPDIQIDNENAVATIVANAGLTEREMHIITRRFGLDNHVPETLEAIGDRMRLTRERIRQIEVNGIIKLKLAAATTPSPEETKVWNVTPHVPQCAVPPQIQQPSPSPKDHPVEVQRPPPCDWTEVLEVFDAYFGVDTMLVLVDMGFGLDRKARWLRGLLIYMLFARTALSAKEIAHIVGVQSAASAQYWRREIGDCSQQPQVREQLDDLFRLISEKASEPHVA